MPTAPPVVPVLDVNVWTAAVGELPQRRCTDIAALLHVTPQAARFAAQRRVVAALARRPLRYRVYSSGHVLDLIAAKLALSSADGGWGWAAEDAYDYAAAVEDLLIDTGGGVLSPPTGNRTLLVGRTDRAGALAADPEFSRWPDDEDCYVLALAAEVARREGDNGRVALLLSDDRAFTGVLGRVWRSRKIGVLTSAEALNRGLVK